VVHLKKAVGFIEFKSIPVGIEATDTMLKSGNVELTLSTAICPGKYISIINGNVGAVKSAVANGEKVAGIHLVESDVIPNINAQVLPALAGVGEIKDVEALGIIETINAISSIVIGDICVKASNIELVEIRIARGLGGKGFVLITGEVSTVKAAIKTAVNEMNTEGVITSHSVIPSPHKDVRTMIL
jgi:microcompartment protein CcmL/EutN